MALPDGGWLASQQAVPGGTTPTIQEMAIQRALLSVSNKAGLAEFARILHEEFNVELLSTGGTAAALREAGLDPHRLELEVTESLFIDDNHSTSAFIEELAEMGVRFALDDFGTGDTAIDYLKKLPIDILKLDRSYVSGALENGADAVITSALISLARNMNLTVIAEGIESKEQYELLRSWKCHLYQGYYCSPAIPSDEFLRLYDATSKPVLQELHS